MWSARTLGNEYFIKPVSTGEHSARIRFELSWRRRGVPHVAKPGVPPPAYEVFTGKNAVLSRVTWQWPITFMYRRIGWSEPFQEGDAMKVITAEPVTATFRSTERKGVAVVIDVITLYAFLRGRV